MSVRRARHAGSWYSNSGQDHSKSSLGFRVFLIGCLDLERINSVFRNRNIFGIDDRLEIENHNKGKPRQ